MLCFNDKKHPLHPFEGLDNFTCNAGAWGLGASSFYHTPFI